MSRKHWSPNHPAVMAWENREPSVAERRRAVVARMPERRRDLTKLGALIGAGLTVGSGFVFDHAQNVGGDWWIVTAVMLGGGLGLLVDAVRRSWE